MEVIQGLSTAVTIIGLLIALIPIAIILTVLSRLKLIGKNTAIIANNQVAMQKGDIERDNQLIATLQYQNKLLTEQNRMLLHIINTQQKPTAQQAPENENT